MDGYDDEEDYTIQIIDTIGFLDNKFKYTDKQIGEEIMKELIGEGEDHKSPEGRRGSVYNKALVPDKIDAILMVERFTNPFSMLETTFEKLAKIFLTTEMKDSILVMLTDVKAAD